MASCEPIMLEALTLSGHHVFSLFLAHLQFIEKDDESEMKEGSSSPEDGREDVT